MSSLRQRQPSAQLPFSPSCPKGATFYACQTGTKFVGCCNMEACANGCSAGSLKPASFDPAYYEKFQDQECPSGSEWYNCAATSPPFMGCCKSNACSRDGCPKRDLAAGFLSSNEKVAADFLPSSTSTTSFATSSTTAPSPSATFDDVAAQTTPTAGPDSKNSTGTIAGASAGGGVALLLLLTLIAFLIRRKAARSRQDLAFSRADTWGQGKEAVVGVGSGQDERAAMIPHGTCKEGYNPTSHQPCLHSFKKTRLLTPTAAIAPELPSYSPAPRHTATFQPGELDGTDAKQRAVAISSEPSKATSEGILRAGSSTVGAWDGVSVDQPSPTVPPSSSRDSTPRVLQSWGDYSESYVSRH